MASSNPQTTLSLPARLLCYIGPPSTILLTSLASPRTGLLSPIAFVPTALGFEAWRKASKTEPEARASLESLIWTFGGVGTVGLTAVMIAQITILSGTARLLFPNYIVRKAFMDEFVRATVHGLTPDEMATRVAFSSSWQNWVFNSSLSFAMAAVTEELLKLSPILFFNRKAKKGEAKLGHLAYLDYALAAGLSFGLVEGIGFLYAACESTEETGWTLARTVAERFIAGSSAHLLYAALTGLRATRKLVYGDQLSWWSVLAPAVLFHGTSNLFAFGLSTLEGNVGWIHPTGFWTQIALYSAVVGVNGLAAWSVRKEWKILRVKEVKDEAKSM